MEIGLKTMKMMRHVFSFAAVLVAVLLSSVAADANQIFVGTFYDTVGNAGNFQLNAQQDTATQWTAVSGTLNVTAGVDTGTYDLYQISSSDTPVSGPPITGPDNPGSVAIYSPSAFFVYDNNIYPTSVPVLDGNGLLFVNTGFGAPNTQEISFWWAGPSSAVYSSGSFNGTTYSYNVLSDTVTFVIPEPSTLVVWSVLFGMVLAFRVSRRTAVSGQMVS
jgi:hypothetical protein